MQTVIYCVRAAGGKHEFYMMADQEHYYLFTQDYRKGGHNYFGKGLMLNEAMDYSRSNRNRAVVHTMDKIPVYIRYVEKLAFEGPFHVLCTGGSIRYVEFSSALLENVQTVEDALAYAERQGVSYIGINFPIDICNGCGQNGTFDQCPYCGSKDIRQIRRVSGYLEEAMFFTSGKKAEQCRMASFRCFSMILWPCFFPNQQEAGTRLIFRLVRVRQFLLLRSFSLSPKIQL